MSRSVQFDRNVPGLFLGWAMIRRPGDDREVSLDFLARIPLPMRNSGRQNNEMPRADGVFFQSDLHTKHAIENQIKLVKFVRVETWAGRPHGQTSDIDERVLGDQVVPDER